MTGPARVTLTIDTLRVTGATGAEARALASALREALAQHLAADPAALAGLGADHLSVTLPTGVSAGPAALGQAAGQQIAAALSSSKGGQS